MPTTICNVSAMACQSNLHASGWCTAICSGQYGFGCWLRSLFTMVVLDPLAIYEAFAHQYRFRSLCTKVVAPQAGPARYLQRFRTQCRIRSLFTKVSHPSIGSDRYVRWLSHYRLVPIAIYKAFAHNPPIPHPTPQSNLHCLFVCLFVCYPRKNLHVICMSATCCC